VVLLTGAVPVHCVVVVSQRVVGGEELGSLTRTMDTVPREFFRVVVEFLRERLKHTIPCINRNDASVSIPLL
jgi:hypothetical protein